MNTTSKTTLAPASGYRAKRSVRAARLASAVGERIRAMREHHGISQAQLGELLGLDTSLVSNVERGITCPLLVVVAAAEVFDVSVDELIPIDCT